MVRRHFSRPAPRTMIWVGGSIPIQVTTVATTLIGSLNAAALALRLFTIIRSRLALNFKSDQEGASEAVSGAYTE